MADGDPELELADLEPDPEPVDTDLPEEPVEGEPQEAEPQETQGQAQAQEPERQPTRGENRFQTLRNENQRLGSDLADTRRRLDELSRQMQQPQVQRESAEQRAARFALMTPQEQMTETLREAEQRQAFREQTFQTQMLDATDRTAFQTKATVDPVYAKWAPKVEGRLAELRARGTNVEREILLKYLIGEAALERRSSKEGKREVVQAQRRVAAQRTRPANAASDTQAQRRGGQSLEQRLENVQI